MSQLQYPLCPPNIFEIVQSILTELKTLQEISDGIQRLTGHIKIAKSTSETLIVLCNSIENTIVNHLSYKDLSVHSEIGQLQFENVDLSLNAVSFRSL